VMGQGDLARSRVAAAVNPNKKADLYYHKTMSWMRLTN
jgi:hypothetical protein